MNQPSPFVHLAGSLAFLLAWGSGAWLMWPHWFTYVCLLMVVIFILWEVLRVNARMKKP